MNIFLTYESRVEYVVLFIKFMCNFNYLVCLVKMGT